MKTFRIAIDAKTIARARMRARQRNVSLSRYIDNALKRELTHEDEYDAAYRSFLGHKPLSLLGERPLTREEIYNERLDELERRRKSSRRMT
jgi:hypothetical protein